MRATRVDGEDGSSGGDDGQTLNNALRSNLAVLVCKLERLHQPHSLLGIASDGQIGDLSVPDDALVADDERGAQGHALIAIGVFLHSVILSERGGRAQVNAKAQ